MAGGIFNPDNWFYRSTEKLVDLVFLSVFWLACCLPVVTIGPATAALYNASVRCIRGDERNSWGVFLRTLRAELKGGVLATLAILPVAVLLIFLQGLLYQTAAGPAGYALYAAYQIFLLLPLGGKPPLLIRPHRRRRRMDGEPLRRTEQLRLAHQLGPNPLALELLPHKQKGYPAGRAETQYPRQPLPHETAP